MNIKNFNKIVIVSLCDRYTQKLAKHLSQTLEMLYCNTKDLIEYELIDKDTLKKIASKDYLDNAERAVFKHVASFENVVVSISYDNLMRHFDLLKGESLVIFVKLSKTFIKEKSTIVNQLAYDVRTQELETVSTLTVGVKKTDIDFVSNKIIEVLGEML